MHSIPVPIIAGVVIALFVLVPLVRTLIKKRAARRYLTPEQIEEFAAPLSNDLENMKRAILDKNKAAGVAGDAKSPYKDSTQIGLSAEVTFLPDAFDEGYSGRFCKTGERDTVVRLLTVETDEKVKNLLSSGWRFIAVDPIRRSAVMATGGQRVYKAFKPNKVVITELISATFRADGLPNKTLITSIADAADVVLTGAFNGSDSLFPTAPNPDNGIAGPTFSPIAVNNGVNWPVVNSGTDFTAIFALESSVLFRIEPPPGYDPTPVSLTAKIRLLLLGPSLR